MAEFGEFDMGGQEIVEELFQLIDTEIMDNLDLTSLESVSSIPDLEEMNENLKKPALTCLPEPETPAECKILTVPTQNKRFKSCSAADLQEFEDARQSKSTKKNTKWAINLFQDWHIEVYKEPLDFENITVEELADRLRKFYCEAKPKESVKRQENLTSVQFETYHKNTLKNLRSAINRHLQNIGRSVDIVHDKEFKSANHTLDGMLKFMTRSGASRPTNHKEVINKDDLIKISSYFKAAQFSPIVLRQCVWFNLSLQFVSRGLEFHHQLRMDSFKFLHDEDGKEYVVLRHETQQKNFQGGLNTDEAPADKRLYAIPDSPSCPVKLLRLLMSKTDKAATNLFNICLKDALSCPTACDIWYSAKALQKQSFSGFMRDICKSAKCQNTYTPHCLRATAISAMNEAGFESRQIMFMSGHRCEASLKTYNKDMSVQQKRMASSVLSTVSNPDYINQNINVSLPNRQLALQHAQPENPQRALSNPLVPLAELSSTQTSVDIQSQSTVSSSRLTEILTKSTFNNCIFNINPNV